MNKILNYLFSLSGREFIEYCEPLKEKQLKIVQKIAQQDYLEWLKIPPIPIPEDDAETFGCIIWQPKE